MLPWTKKYQPKSSSEIVGQEPGVRKLKSYLNPKKPILLYGPTGSGKSSAVYAIAKEHGLEVFEINSADTRNKKGVERMLGQTIVQQSLFSKGKIILIDDVDALSGRSDRGGLPTIMKMFTETKFSIVLTCTNPWSDKLSKLRRKCTLVEFSALRRIDMEEYLKKILTDEGISFKPEDIQVLAKKSNGDLRAALNDAQTHSITKELIIDDQGERNRTEDIQYCLRKVLKGQKWDDVHNVFQNIDMDINESMLWLDENLPREYSGEALRKAYERISRADVFNGRIRRWQHWRFLVYMSTLLTSGVAFSKESTNPTFVEYKRTKRILKLWMAKQRYAKKNSICDKIAVATHTSKKQAKKSTFPYLKKVLLQRKFIKELELSDEEIAWLKK